jgi:hypothetical protein
MQENFDRVDINHLCQFLIDDFGMVKINESQDSKNFGNFSITLSSDDFLINYVNDRLFFTIEIRNKTNLSDWYDLSTIKNFIYNPQDIYKQDESLNNETRINQLNEFLKNDFKQIEFLFSNKNYPGMKKSLDKLLREQFERNINKRSSSRGLPPIS